MTLLRLIRTHALVIAETIAFLLAIAFAAQALIGQEKDTSLSNSQAQVQRFVNGAVVAVNRTLLGFDVMLASLDETLDLGRQHLDSIDIPAASHNLQTIVHRNLMLRRLALFDASGRSLASSDTAGTETAAQLPASFVAQVLAAQIPALNISAPVRDAVSSDQVVYLARHIRLADGSRVIAVAEVLLTHLNNIIVQGADITGLEVTLERSNGQLLASMPAQDKLLGSVLAQPIALVRDAAQPMPARLSGQTALLVAQPILYDDLLITASVPLASSLSQWQHERDLILFVAALFALMVLGAAGFTIWYLDRLTTANEAIKKTKADVEQLAFYDHLTELPNRLLLTERLTQALIKSERHRHLGALLFMDLDNFKSLNDTQGHDVGDLLLKQVATRLKSGVRAQDTVARLGGDEFVILLEDLSDNLMDAAALARRIGEKLLASLNEPYPFAKHTHKSSASLGAAMFGTTPTAAADLLKQADIAMYQAKARGRNALCFFDPQMQAAISAHAQLQDDLQEAVAQQQFRLVFQTQVTQSGRIVGAEVLIRWQHPLRGEIQPVEFVAVAEESDLINQIGAWVLRTACQQLRRWQDTAASADLQLAVNVSARQFRQPDFVAQVEQVLHDTGIAAHGLKLELTESLVLANVDDTITKMGQLRALGVRFSMDDFGTGQSSLSYLTRLPLDQLKIDQSFVRNIGISPRDAIIVQTIIGMARNLGLEVIAEGVETRQQQVFLADNGCTLYQGYLFGKPSTLADFEHLLEIRTPVTVQPEA